MCHIIHINAYSAVTKAKENTWGTSTVSVGAYLQVLLVLGLENDLAKVAEDDSF